MTAPVPPTVTPPVHIGVPTDPGAYKIPPGIGFLATLIIVGLGAELIYEASPKAAYLLVAVVIIGYMAASGRIENVTAFLDKIQGLGSN